MSSHENFSINVRGNHTFGKMYTEISEERFSVKSSF